MTPLTDAMGFVNCDSRELALSIDGCQVLAEGGGKSILGSDVKEPGEGMACERSDLGLSPNR